MTTKTAKLNLIVEFLTSTLLVSMFVLPSGFMLFPVKAEPKIIYVDVANSGDPNEDGSWDHPFNTIQEGVDAAEFGDVVSVAAGVYHEYVQITKSSISLLGQSGVIVDGDGVRNGIRVGAFPPNYAENVSISGFTIQNCVRGVVLVRCSYALFRNVSLVNSVYGFSDYSLQVNYVDTSNTVNGKPIYYWVEERDKQVPADAGYIVLVNCTNIIVKDLNLTGNGQGIVLKYTSNSTIENVNVSSNWDGVYIDAWSSNNTIVNSKVVNNSFMGIYISKSRGNTIINLEISKNSYGIFLDEFSTANILMNNTITENQWGLYLNGENGKISENIIMTNTVSNNKVGISLLYSENNIIYHNNFINNSDQAYAYGSVNTWDCDGEGNYWSDYTGKDSDNNHVGDTPYIINKDNIDNYPLTIVIPEFSSFSLLLLFAVSLVVTLLNKRKHIFDSFKSALLTRRY